jgi:hypothetical protein
MTVDPFTDALARSLLAEYDADRWLADPAAWVVETLREEVWSKQAEVLASVRDNRRTAVKSCHGVGKSHIAARAAAWWLAAHPAGEAFIVTTAPTFPQVRAILWRYIRQAHRKGTLPGRVNQTEWLIDDEIVGYGRKPADHDEQAFQGIHARYVLVIIDEACGVPEQLWIAADSLTTNDDCRILAIGNPDDPGAYFRRACDSPLWHSIRISAFDSPNLSGEPISENLSRLLISRGWVEEKLVEWGEDSPVYISKVLGEFPSDDPNAVVRYTDLIRCKQERAVPYKPDELLPVELGVDVGGGGDETVIRERLGVRLGRTWKNRSDRPEDLAPEIIKAIVLVEPTAVKVDSNGIGWGVIGELRNRQRHADPGSPLAKCRIVPVNFGEGAGRPDKYANRRAEVWWEVGRLAAEQGAVDLSAGENVDALIAQLVAPTWDTDTKDRIRIETKDDVRKRLGRSPDDADAYLLAYYVPPGTSGYFDALVDQQKGHS